MPRKRYFRTNRRETKRHASSQHSMFLLLLLKVSKDIKYDDRQPIVRWGPRFTKSDVKEMQLNLAVSVVFVALKSLIDIHRALREVDPTFHEELINYGRCRSHMLNLAHFKDDLSANGLHYSAWVRTYALFWEERLECFRVLKYDVETDGRVSKDIKYDDMQPIVAWGPRFTKSDVKDMRNNLAVSVVFVALKSLIHIHLSLREVEPTFHDELINYGRCRSHMLKDDLSANATRSSSSEFCHSVCTFKFFSSLMAFFCAGDMEQEANFLEDIISEAALKDRAEALQALEDKIAWKTARERQAAAEAAAAAASAAAAVAAAARPAAAVVKPGTARTPTFTVKKRKTEEPLMKNNETLSNISYNYNSD